jgi:hypothetical protein
VLRTVLGAAMSGGALLGCYTFPCVGQCGWASLFPALSYGLQASDGQSELPDRRCPIPSHCSGQWCLFREYDASGYLIWC